MSWTIILADENNKPISSLNNEFDISVNLDISNFRLLRYLDANGDTIFNRLQMDDLIMDLQSLKQTAANPLLDEIQALAERCKKEEHLYLVFYGD